MTESRPRVLELDGLRGVAILLVVLFHYFGRFYNGDRFRYFFGANGWVGVDLFFVLSGYLITQRLLQTRRQNFYYRDFFIRRVLRIFPLYFFTLVVTLMAVPLFLGTSVKSALAPVLDDQIYLWTFTSNLAMARDHKWMFWSPIFNFAHFWTLAIEEQFYLVWPFLIKNFLYGKKWLIFIPMILFSILLRYQTSGPAPTNVFSYVFTFCRIDGLLLGAAVAAIFEAPRLRALIKPIGIGAFCVSLILVVLIFKTEGDFYFARRQVAVWGYSAIDFLFASVLIFALVFRPQAWLRIFLRSAVLRAFGKFSFAIYIFHVLIEPLGDLAMGHSALWTYFETGFGGGYIYALLMTGVCFVLAAVSWKCLEAKALNLAPRMILRSHRW